MNIDVLFLPDQFHANYDSALVFPGWQKSINYFRIKKEVFRSALNGDSV